MGGYLIKNCYNIGCIQGKSNMLTNGDGGIIGYSDSGVIIENCYNNGTVISKWKEKSGGIIGHYGNATSISNCYNMESVGNGGIAGVIGSNNLKMKDCYNTGKCLGGICGYFAATTSSMENCIYLTGTASTGISELDRGNPEVKERDVLPSVLSVINGDNAFVEDTNNINNGYPILSWQTQSLH